MSISHLTLPTPSLSLE